MKDLCFFISVVIGRPDENGISSGKIPLQLSNHRSEIQISDIGNQDADNVGTLRSQGARIHVARIAEFINRTEYFIAHLVRHRGRSVDHIGNRRLRYAGTQGDILHSGPFSVQSNHSTLNTTYYNTRIIVNNQGGRKMPRTQK